MADYIYLLQTRLTAAQQSTVQHVRTVARARAMTVFLVGGAVRDLTTGSPIRDLDFAVQGNALKLKKDLERVGGRLSGENELTQTLYFNFPGGVRMEVGSTLSVVYPKPGKPVYKPATILEDLRRRDFTANAMAISLNDGSFGLLMDPLNGIADLENRELRLVSNYGFIEDPSRMIRATRFSARLGWNMEEKTYQRYENGKAEGYISALLPSLRGYELEEIFHEEDPLRVLKRLESEGWAKVLFPAWTSKHVNEVELGRLRDTIGQLEAMGIHPDPSAAFFPLLTAKLTPKDVAALKASFARPGFAQQIAALDVDTKAFTTVFTGKSAAAPSEAWKLLFSAEPEPVLWLAHSSKSAPVQARLKAFLTEWSQSRQRIPYQLMQEMRIVPELPIYGELLEKLFFAIMDGKLDTPEAARAFLEPFSPPAPPPPVNLRRRAVKRETKPAKSRSKKAVAIKADEQDEVEVPAGTTEAAPAAAKESKPAPVAKVAAVKTVAPKPAAPKPASPAKAVTPAKPAAKAVAKVPAKAAVKSAAPVKAAAVKLTPKAAPKKLAVPAKDVKAKPSPAKKAVKPAPAKKAVKLVPKAASKPTAKTVTKKTPPAAKKAVKAAPKPPAKKTAPNKVTPKKAAPKKPAPKPTSKPVKAAKRARR